MRLVIRKRGEDEHERARARRTISAAKEHLRKRLPPTYESSVSRTMREARELLDDIAKIAMNKKHKLRDLMPDRPSLPALPTNA